MVRRITALEAEYAHTMRLLHPDLTWREALDEIAALRTRDFLLPLAGPEPALEYPWTDEAPQ